MPLPRTAIAAMIAGIALFTALAASIWPGSPLDRLDAAVMAAVREMAGTDLLRAAHFVSLAGDARFITPLAIAVAAALAARRLWQAAGVWAFTLGGGVLVHRALKSVFERMRPLHDHGLVVENGWSFPSNHASMSLVTYGMLAWLLLYFTHGRGVRPIIALAVLLVLAIGASRVVLQVHFPSDVLAGYASGSTWLAASIVCMRMATRRHAAAVAVSDSTNGKQAK